MMMTIVIAVSAIVVACLALVLAFGALRTLARLRRSVVVLSRGGARRESLIEAVARQTETANSAFGRITGLDRTVGERISAIDRSVAERMNAMERSIHRRVSAVERSVGDRMSAAEAASVARFDQMGAAATERLTRIDAELTTGLDASRTDAARSLRNIALIRFDAFDDMAGRLSFTLAMLDDHGDGIALTALAGPTDTRVYAKGVNGGAGASELSPEESDAVRAALTGKAAGDRSRAHARRETSAKSTAVQSPPIEPSIATSAAAQSSDWSTPRLQHQVS